MATEGTCRFGRFHVDLTTRQLLREFRETETGDECPESAGFLAINPAGELPVLQIEGAKTPLCGIYAISEFLAEGAAPVPVSPRRPE